ncbi:patatin-like phospholipase domain-containing protein 4 [Grammomys surdaster]|uniref:patatin-like phospholipase domain-containing protein 4 n=1 Tax=Grammomys surdaster TaxID=491861 RepID=UPI00109F7BD2|nr:patatin-like phospholipase domain-containing protein 4 [Grammomys surdaster]
MPPLHLSFSACGFLGVYHLGAATALRGRGLLRDVTGLAGASAGALTAAVLLTAPGQIEACTKFTYDLAEEARARVLGPATPGFDLMSRVRAALDAVLPRDAHELARGRLLVSVTRVAGLQGRRVSDFASRDELITVLLASCFVPVYAGLKPVEHAGQLWMDGGLTDSLPVMSTGRTVTFSPFAGSADVSPREHAWACVSVAGQDVAVSWANLVRARQAMFPACRQTLEAIYHRGMTDTVRFLREELRPP